MTTHPTHRTHRKHPTILLALLTSSLLALFPATTLAAKDKDDTQAKARAILEKAQTAWDQVSNFSITIEGNSSGAFARILPKATANATYSRVYNKKQLWAGNVDGSAKSKGGEPFKFAFAFDGSGAFAWLDKQAKTRVRGRQLPKTWQPLLKYYTPEVLFTPNPFTYAIEHGDLSYVESKKIDGQKCDIVRAKLNSADIRTFAISTKDSLPREVVHDFSIGAVFLTLTDLKILSDVDQSLYSMPLPDGYQDGVTPATTLKPAIDPAQGRTKQPLNTTARHVQNTPSFNWELPTADGESLALADLRGDVVLLEFWGTWCIPCKKATPAMQDLHDLYSDNGLRILGLACKERNADAPIKYFEDHALTYDLLLDADKVAARYKVKQFPTFILIGHDGVILDRFVGFKDDVTVPLLTTAIEGALQARYIEFNQK